MLSDKQVAHRLNDLLSAEWREGNIRSGRADD